MCFANFEKRQYYHQFLPHSTYQESDARSNPGIFEVNTALQIEKTILRSWWKISCRYFRKNLSLKIDKINNNGLFLHLVYSDSGTEIKIDVLSVEFSSTSLKLSTEILIDEILLVFFQKIHFDKRKKFVLLFGILNWKFCFKFFEIHFWKTLFHCYSHKHDCNHNAFLKKCFFWIFLHLLILKSA